MTVAVDLGSSAVKVATDAHSPVLVAHPIDPELAARVGTTVPLIRREGSVVITQAPHEAYVRAVATALDGTTAESVAIVTPDWWTNRARDMVEQTLQAHEAGRFLLVSPAIAAVRAAAGKHRLPTTVAVLDIGAESSSTAVVVTADDGVHRVVGRPAVLHGQAGNHIDRRLMQHVLGWLSSDINGYEPSRAEIATAGQSLQTQVKAAKELLSTRPVATLTPDLPGANVELRLVRSDFDEVARETIDAIVAMLKANIVVNAPDGVEAVLLTGGSVSIPLVTQVISVELGLPVILENDPATLAVRGAATVEVPEPPRRRRWLPRRRVGAGHVAFDLKNAPAPQSEPYVEVLPEPEPEPSAEPQGRHAAASQPEQVVPDPSPPETEDERHPGGRLESFIDISRRQAAATQSVPVLAPVHLVVETEDGSGSSRSTRWASAPEPDSSWEGARRVYVDEQGQFRLTVNDRDYEIDMGTELASTSVSLLLIGLHVFVTLSENGKLLRELQLNPEHDFRPE